MSDRGVAPVIGVVLVVAISIILAVVVLGMLSLNGTDPPPTARIEGAVDTTENNITLTHAGGDSLDIEDLEFQIVVDGEQLVDQLQLPFYSHPEFEHLPSGPFNPQSSNIWKPGESGTLQLADRPPTPTIGSTVIVRITVDGVHIAERELQVR